MPTRLCPLRPQPLKQFPLCFSLLLELSHAPRIPSAPPPIRPSAIAMSRSGAPPCLRRGVPSRPLHGLHITFPALPLPVPIHAPRPLPQICPWRGRRQPWRPDPAVAWWRAMKHRRRDRSPIHYTDHHRDRYPSHGERRWRGCRASHRPGRRRRIPPGPAAAPLHSVGILRW
ncbi:hypothetical protein PVAP13_9NG743377 [Panicum virgatum]|uniref:Uncharacterized protein n=1 Tax=Panicum virgatum TaxID=38727 RepID=A0A8T0N4Y3_PANVG|nr:hypothetical protein PVAP13_9NG743377 [Panicum virgatum]